MIHTNFFAWHDLGRERDGRSTWQSSEQREEKLVEGHGGGLQARIAWKEYEINGCDKDDEDKDGDVGDDGLSDASWDKCLYGEEGQKELGL